MICDGRRNGQMEGKGRMRATKMQEAAKAGEGTAILETAVTEDEQQKPARQEGTKEEQRMYDQLCLETFLKEQGRLFDEPVADTLEEAEEFLEECMAVVLKNLKEVRKYFEENMDAAGMSDQELSEACEVFSLPDGRFLVVEG